MKIKDFERFDAIAIARPWTGCTGHGATEALMRGFTPADVREIAATEATK